METQKKGRGRPKIKPSIRALISEKAIRYKSMPRLMLAAELRDFIEKQGELPPSEEYTMRLISEARNHPKSPLDSQWSVGCLGQRNPEGLYEYDIPPEALPKVMFIYEKRLRELKQHFTIREVLWIARLHETIDNPILLEELAYAYALREQIDFILDNPTYTRDLDFTVIKCRDGRITAADVIEHPYKIHPLPTWGYEEEAELEKKLRSKGYSVGIALTEEEARNERKHKAKR